MTSHDIRIFGDPVLTSRADEITTFDDSLKHLVEDMFDTMDAAGGVGLAEEDGMRGHIINPQWEPVGEETQLGPEGCLSIPEVLADTERYQTVRVTGYDYDGNPLTITASGLMARCIQHETDHLDGVLFLRRLTPERRKEAMAYIRQADWFNK